LLVEPEEEHLATESDKLSPADRWSLLKKLFPILKAYETFRSYIEAKDNEVDKVV